MSRKSQLRRIATSVVVVSATAAFTVQNFTALATSGGTVSAPSGATTQSSRGMAGLVKRTSGPCAGLYEATESPGLCTHGPDGPPSASYTIDTPVPAAAPRASAKAIVCAGDGVTGNRAEVLYIRESTSPDRFAQYLASFRTWSDGLDTIIDQSAAETGGSRHVRFVTDSACAIVVRNVVVPAGSLASFGSSVAAVKNAGYNRTDRKYSMYMDSTVLCGVAGVMLDSSSGQSNANNFGPSYARVDSGCWGSNAATHEFTHTLGAVQSNAPNASAAGHCTDDYDIMCYKDGPNVVVRIVCTDPAHDNRLDCNHDDYFSTNPTAGGYLATHWNTANNQFLISGTTTTPPPTSGTITGPGAKCVDVSGNDTGVNGAAVQLWDCQSAAVDQHWAHLADTSLKTLGRCMDVISSGTANGTQVQLYDCNGTGAQKWTQQSDGSLKNPQSGRCLDSPNGSTANGARLQIWDCNGSAAQKFHLN